MSISKIANSDYSHIFCLTRHKKLSEMSQEELDAYHKRFMPK